MKIVTKAQQDAAGRAAMTGAAKGASLGLAVFIPAFYIAGRRFPAVRNLPPVQKGWLSLCAFLAGGATNAELSYERFIREQWNDPSADRLHKAQRAEEDMWLSMSPKEKALKFARDNRYQLVFGSWLASMVGSAAFIFSRNPQQTFSQKLVQCRMVAQGATVAVLIASAGLSQLKFEEDAFERHNAERGWEEMISQPRAEAPPLGSVHPSHAGRH